MAEVDERRTTLMVHTFGGQPSTKHMVEGLFGVNNFDGLKANRDW